MRLLALVVPTVLATAQAAAKDFPSAPIETVRVALGVPVRMGPGGVLSGEDGVVLIDDPCVPLTDE
jgi:hypothetical protein